MSKKKVTCHVLMAIDASGSMWNLADDVRGGFNQYVTDLYNDATTNYRLTVYLFNTDVWSLCDDVRLHHPRKAGEIPELDRVNYAPGKGTALLDAIGGLINNQPDGYQVGDRVLVVVNTDGQENSSREWTLPGIKRLIAERENVGDGENPLWGFVFLGAGLDNWQQGERMGFSSVQTFATSGGTRGMYSGLAGNTQSYAAGASAQSVADSIAADSAAGDEEERHGH
jgi:hypothetical protein